MNKFKSQMEIIQTQGEMDTTPDLSVNVNRIIGEIDRLPMDVYALLVSDDITDKIVLETNR